MKANPHAISALTAVMIAGLACTAARTESLIKKCENGELQEKVHC